MVAFIDDQSWAERTVRLIFGAEMQVWVCYTDLKNKGFKWEQINVGDFEANVQMSITYIGPALAKK